MAKLSSLLTGFPSTKNVGSPSTDIIKSITYKLNHTNLIPYLGKNIAFFVVMLVPTSEEINSPRQIWLTTNDYTKGHF